MAKKAKQKLGPLQKKWLAALESGKYRQARGQLCKRTSGHYGYCCLGVAAHVCLGKPVYMLDGAKILRNAWYTKLGLRGASAPPKHGVYHSAGLTYLNDGSDDEHVKKHTFKQIAAIIRKDPSVYFRSPK